MWKRQLAILEVEILGIPIRGMLDSGSSKTVIGGNEWNIIQALNLPLKRLPFTMVKTASEQECPILGSIDIHFWLADRVFLVSALVIPAIKHELILEVDFWTQMGIVPNLQKNYWTFFNSDPEISTELATITPRTILSSSQEQQLHLFTTNCFEKMGHSLGCAKNIKHKIIITNPEPIKLRPYRPAMQQIIDLVIKKC